MPVNLENTQFSPSRCAFGGSLGTWTFRRTFKGGWTLDFSECPIDPLGGGGWTLDFSESPTNPPGLDLGLLKRANPGTGGKGLQSDVRISVFFYERARLAPYELTHVQASPGDCEAGWAQAWHKI